MDKPKEKSEVLKQGNENLVLQFRKDYNRLKLEPEFPKYGLAYLKAMKTLNKANDVYCDCILLKIESKKMTDKIKELEMQEDNVALKEKAFKKENERKELLSDMYSLIRVNINATYEQCKTEYKEQIKAILKVQSVNSTGIQKAYPEHMAPGIKKHLNLFDQELRLILKKDWITSQFENHKKTITDGFNKIFRKVMDSKSVLEIIELTRKKLTLNNASSSNLTLDSSALMNTSKKSPTRQESTDEVEVFKKPSFPIARGRKSTVNISMNESSTIGVQDISNPILNVSDNEINQGAICDRSPKKDQITNASPAKTNLTNPTETIVKERNKTIDVKIENDIKTVPIENSTKLSPKSSPVSHQPSDDSFMNDILVESTKKQFLPPTEKKKTPAIVPAAIPSEETFKKNIHYESTKISKIPAEKANEKVPQKVKAAQNVITTEIDVAKVPSQMTFMKNIKHESTKINSSLKRDDNTLGNIAEIDAMKERSNAAVNVSTKESYIKSNSESKSRELSKSKSGGDGEKNSLTMDFENLNIDNADTMDNFGKNIPLAQSTTKLNVITNLSMIAELSEPSSSSITERNNSKSSQGSQEKKSKSSNSNSGGERSQVLSTHNSNDVKSSGIPTLRGSKKVMTASEIDAAKSKESKSMTSTKEDEKENSEKDLSVRGKASIESIHKLDSELETIKSRFDFGFGQNQRKLTSTEININGGGSHVYVFDGISIDPWTATIRKKIWLDYLPKLRASARVKQVKEDSSTDVIFADNKFGDLNLSIKKPLHTTDSGGLFIGRFANNIRDYVIKIQNSTQCIDHYFYVYIQSSLKELSKERALEWNINIFPSICPILSLTLSDTRSYILMPYYNRGSLVDLCSALYNNSFLPQEIELLTSYLALELLTILLQLNSRVQLLHCQINPRNIMINELFPIIESDCEFQFNRTGVIVLLDFKKAICMKRFPKECKFLTEDKNSSESCVESKLKRPWSYEIDLFNVATTLYFLLQNSFPCVMEIKERRVFNTMNNVKSLRAINLWLNLFDRLLNYHPTVYEDIIIFAEELAKLIKNNIGDYNSGAEKINSVLATER